MDEETINQIGELAETLDNGLFGYKNMPTLSPHIHLQGMSGIMKEVRNDLAKLYKKLGGKENLNLQA